MSLVYNPHIGGSVAVQSGTVTGNTLGASTYSGTNIVVAGGSNLTVEVQSASRLVFHAGGGTATGGAGAGTDWSINGGSITVNTSGGTISLPAYLTTAQPPGAYLTTAQPPGAYLTTAAQSDHSHGALSLVNLTGTSSSNGLTLSAAAPGGGAAIMVSAGTTSGNVQTLALLDSNGVSFGLNGSTVTASHNGYTGATTQFLTTTPRLDEIRNPTTDAVIAMNTRQLQLQWGTNFTTFSTATNRQGLVEFDLAGDYTGTDKVDLLHIHQSTFDPNVHLVHIEAVGTNPLPLHILASASAAAWMNRPIVFTRGTHTEYPNASVPLILGTEASNSIANLNAHYLQGRLSSALAGTAGAITGGSITVNTAGVSVNLPAYLTTAQPVGAYLTTARASNDAVGLNTALTANGVSWTVNSSGLSLNVPAFLTTAAQVSHSHGNPTLALTNLTGTTASGSNGLTLSLSAAAPGGGGVGLNTAQTNVTWTVNTSGISLNAGGYAGTGTSGTQATFTLNSAGLAFNAGAYLTTAAGVSHTHGAGPTLTGPVAATSASNGLSLNVNAIGNTTAATNVTWTVGTNGLSLNAGGYAGTTTAATNATFTLNSAGLALSVAAPGAGGGVAIAGSGASTVTSGTLQFANLNGVSFGLNGSTMTASYSSNHSHGNPTLALTNLSGTTASASNGFTLSLAAAAPGGGAAIPVYAVQPPWNAHGGSMALLTNITGISRRLLLMPFENFGSLSYNELHWQMSRSTSGSNAFSVFMGVYSFVNSSRIDSVFTTSGVYSATATASVSGLRGFELTFDSASLSPGQYVLGLMFDPVGGSTASMNYSIMGAASGNTIIATQVVNGTNTYHTNVNHMWAPFHGRFSVTTAALPASIPAASVLAVGNVTNQPLPVYWVLGTHYA